MELCDREAENVFRREREAAHDNEEADEKCGQVSSGTTDISIEDADRSDEIGDIASALELMRRGEVERLMAFKDERSSFSEKL